MSGPTTPIRAERFSIASQSHAPRSVRAPRPPAAASPNPHTMTHGLEEARPGGSNNRSRSWTRQCSPS